MLGFRAICQRKHPDKSIPNNSSLRNLADVNGAALESPTPMHRLNGFLKFGNILGLIQSGSRIV
jgi:hypothetical protein